MLPQNFKSVDRINITLPRTTYHLTGVAFLVFIVIRSDLLIVSQGYLHQLNFGFQSVFEGGPAPPIDFVHPNSFYCPEETEQLASCGYQQTSDLGITEDENIHSNGS